MAGECILTHLAGHGAQKRRAARLHARRAGKAPCEPCGGTAATRPLRPHARFQTHTLRRCTPSHSQVKFTQQTWHDKLSKILDDFPRVEDIHPFYADLLNVLYDRDHYKLALGHVNMARNLISKVSKDYVRLLKYGDSLYRCKMLKRAALGRMATIMKRQGPSLQYLEQVRQHMGRLPSIDPNTRTLLLTGFPNVGKSSFMNKVTRADVEVQPYAFTTKSLYVGHMDYKYLRWQVIDTPGILDHALEQRNTIEMQAVTALAHLRAAVLYVVDISEQCGYTLEAQASLFHSIKPLFINKPLLVVCNKTDARAWDELSAEQIELIDEMRKVADPDAVAAGEPPLTMSTVSEQGVMEVKQRACERLLAARVEAKMRGNKIEGFLNRVHVAQPRPRGGAGADDRPANIPASVLAEQALTAPQREAARGSKRTEKDLEEEKGGAGAYSMDWRKRYLLENPEWKHDPIPEIVDGHNVADFVDPDIEARLEELEREEEAAAAAAEGAMDEDDGEDTRLTEDETRVLGRIRTKKAVVKQHSRREKVAGQHRQPMPRTAQGARAPGKTAESMAQALEQVGIDPRRAVSRARSRSRVREENVERGRKRERSRGAELDSITDGGMDVDADPAKKLRAASRARSASRARGASATPEPAKMGLRDEKMQKDARKKMKKMQRLMNKNAKIGEADRVILTKMPKHLFSGKTTNGTRDWR